MGFDSKHRLIGVRFVNLTPHEIVIRPMDGGPDTAIPPSGTVARASSVAEMVMEVNGIEVVRAKFGPVEGLPAPEIGVMYVVSALVAQVSRRDDLLAPDTSPQGVVRDAGGKIVAVRRFQVF